MVACILSYNQRKSLICCGYPYKVNAETLIKKLDLLPHPEGGYYKETYRCADKMTLPGNRERNTSTAIYYLLENGDRSHFHRIKSDELWFFHQGETLEIVSIENGELRTVLLGNRLGEGEVPQTVIPANTWFASCVKEGKGFALASCTVAPGFDFADFEMAGRETLLKEYPHLKTIIEKFTR